MNTMYSLEQYHEWAKQCIFSFAGHNIANRLISDDDVVGEIATALMEGDWKWDGRGNQEGYRKQCGKWAVGRIITKLKKKKNLVSLSTPVYKSRTTSKELTLVDTIQSKDKPVNNLQEILSISKLTDKQKQCVVNYYEYDYNMDDIAQTMGITRQAVQQTLERALSKIRKVVHNNV